MVIYFEREVLDEQVRDLEAAGYRFFKPPTDERWLWREAAGPFRQRPVPLPARRESKESALADAGAMIGTHA